MTTTAPCRAKVPASCPYHGAIIRMETAAANGKFEEYFEARLEVERLRKQGGDDIVTPTMTYAGTPTPEAKKVATALKNSIGSLIQEWHSTPQGSRLMIENKIAEAIIETSLTRAGHQPNLDLGSHKVGADIHLGDMKGKTDDGLGISVKTGTTTVTREGKTSISISGSRTGTHKTLEDKLNFLKTTSPDVYTCVSRPKKINEGALKNKNAFSYTVYVFSGDILNYGKPDEWTKSESGVPSIATDNFSARIVDSMSGQVWTKLNADTPGVIAIEVPVKF